jgi:hypothetical protein
MIGAGARIRSRSRLPPNRGSIPSIDEAKKRLAHLQERRPMPFAFSFRTIFPPDEDVVRATDWSAFEPCPAV